MMARFVLVFVLTANVWPQWRGPGRDGVAADFVPPATWPSELALSWDVSIGAGYASPIVLDDDIYIHSRRDEKEVVSRLELGTGRVVWSRDYAAPSTKSPEFARSEGEGPYATPLLHDARLFTVGVNAIVSSFDAATGDVKWRRDFSDRIVSAERFCGAASSPVIDGDALIVHVGDDDSGEILALDKDTGETRWSTEGEAPGSASPMILEVAGKRQLVTLTDPSVVGLAADTGELLWSLPFPSPLGSCSLNIVTPVVFGETVIVSARERGTRAIDVRSADVVWENDDVAMFWSTPVLDGDTLYGISHLRKGQLFAMDVRTGETLWSTEGREGETGFVIGAGPLVMYQMHGGELVVAKKGRDQFDPVARYEVAASPVWSHPVLLDGALIVRVGETLKHWSFR